MPTSSAPADAAKAEQATAPAAPAAIDSDSREAPEAAPAAKPKVAIVVEGARSAAVRKNIEKMLGEHYDVISTRRYQKTARRLKAKKMKERNVVKVAGKLDADAVLHVVLRKKSKKRYKLSVRLRHGTTGKTLERFTLDLRGRSLRNNHQRKLAGKLMPQIDELAPVAEPTQAVASSRRGSQTRVAELSRDTKSDNDRRSAQRVKYDDRGQVIDNEVPPGF